jgi:hypothetical protein
VVEIGATQESPLLWILLALELEVMVGDGGGFKIHKYVCTGKKIEV